MRTGPVHSTEGSDSLPSSPHYQRWEARGKGLGGKKGESEGERGGSW